MVTNKHARESVKYGTREIIASMTLEERKFEAVGKASEITSEAAAVSETLKESVTMQAVEFEKMQTDLGEKDPKLIIGYM